MHEVMRRTSHPKPKSPSAKAREDELHKRRVEFYRPLFFRCLLKGAEKRKNNLRKASEAQAIKTVVIDTIPTPPME